MSRALFLALAGVIGLCACAPLETYYRPGGSVADLNRDTLACEVQALRDVPISYAVRRLPPVFVPGKKICDAAGNCKSGKGRYVPGGIERFDPNEGLRFRVERQCMADKGYAPVSIPACPDAVAKAAPARATTRLPALSDTSCVIRNSNGTFQIVNRG
jgi:hypothetical protein